MMSNVKAVNCNGSNLVMLVSKTKVLEKLMSQLHQLVHSRVVLFVIRNLQEIEHDYVNSDVSQQPLLVLARLRCSTRAWLDAELVHSD